MTLPLILSLGLLAAEHGPCGPIPSFIDAFNRRDLDEMVEHLEPKAGWHYVGGGEIFIEARGADKIRESMARYFEAHPDTRSTIGDCQVNGPFISFVETAVWPTDDGPRSQRATAVYRIRDGKIREAYYFPAVRTDPVPSSLGEAGKD